jgi:hypothetical protein
MTMMTFDNPLGRRGVAGTELVHGRPARTYGKGRVCSAAGCETTLSRYNPNAGCWIHSNS